MCLISLSSISKPVRKRSQIVYAKFCFERKSQKNDFKIQRSDFFHFISQVLYLF